MSLKPICVKCRRFMRMKRNGVYFTEAMPVGNSPPPGLEAPDRWQPYKVWCGDMWHCPTCGYELLAGVGLTPVAERHHRDFADTMHRIGADKITINDC